MRRRSWSSFPPYVPVAERRRKAETAAKKLVAKGEALDPVQISGVAIARTFWGRSWLANLDRYADFANRLPRGRSYVRSGAVLDLRIEKRIVRARVQGSSLYTVTIEIDALAAPRWHQIRKECAGAIDTVVDLLAGKLSQSVMALMTDPGRGLFPNNREIRVRCSCPDIAHLCKHAIAALCGVGNRLDSKPELLFLLRGVDHAELIDEAVQNAGKIGEAASVALSNRDLEEIFGFQVADPTEPIEIAATVKTPRKAARKSPAKKSTTTASRTSAKTGAKSAATRSAPTKGSRTVPRKASNGTKITARSAAGKRAARKSPTATPAKKRRQS